MRWVAGVALGLAVSGCATTAIPGQGLVTVTANAELARGCRFLGQDNHYLSSMPAFMAVDALREQSRRAAALKGGNLVVSPGPQVGAQGALGYPMVTMNADVYACPESSEPIDYPPGVTPR